MNGVFLHWEEQGSAWNLENMEEKENKNKCKKEKISLKEDKSNNLMIYTFKKSILGTTLEYIVKNE